LVVVLAVVAYFAASRAMNSFYSSIMNPAPIKRTGPYNFGYESESAHVIIQLPDGYGQLTYMHRPEGTGPAHPADGSRGIALKSAGHKPQEWPLPYYQLRTVRVGLYWHPAKNNMGPFLRFYDATGEFVLDLKRNEIAELVRENGKVFIGD
jgi:hypothetical protein